MDCICSLHTCSEQHGKLVLIFLHMVFGRTLIIYCNIYYPSCPFLGYLLLFVSFLVDSFVVGARVSFSNGRKMIKQVKQLRCSLDFGVHAQMSFCTVLLL